MIHMTFHKKDTSEKIKEATLNLLAAEGYDAISMRKIAKEANVALGQLTYYYRTKDNLIESVVREVLEIFYDEFERKITENKYNINIIIDGIKSILDEETKVEKLLITIISQSQVNKTLQKILREFWIKIVNLTAKCYKENIKGITEEKANIKARLLIGSAIENIVEKILCIDFGINDELSLIGDAAERLGECE